MIEGGTSEGLFALLSAIVGGALTVSGDWIRNWNDRKRRAQYLAIRCIIALDAFVGNCASALTNNPEAPPGTNPDDVFDMPDRFQIPDDVDWTSISHSLSHRILSIPQRDSAAREAVRFILGVADGYAACESRNDDFIKLSLDSAAIAAELRRLYRIRNSEIKGWNPVKILNDLKNARLKDDEKIAEAAE